MEKLFAIVIGFATSTPFSLAFFSLTEQLMKHFNGIDATVAISVAGAAVTLGALVISTVTSGVE